MYVAADIKSGRLVAPFGPAVTSREGYHLICAEHLEDAMKTEVFRAWIFAEAHKKRAD